MKTFRSVPFVFSCLALPLLAGAPWPHAADSRPLRERIAPPAGYTRMPVPEGSFGAWLRELPLKPGLPPVVRFDGEPVDTGNGHAAVVDLDIGSRNLQQCADLVIRMRAEYLRQRGAERGLCFHYTSGAPSRFAGGNETAFRRWLDGIYTYASTASIRREGRVLPPAQIAPGDYFVSAGRPAHAVLVVDVARNASGETVFLLAQGNLPAQSFHIPVNPGDPALSPWYRLRESGRLHIAWWDFEFADLRRFAERAC